jgi:hypothetical protein
MRIENISAEILYLLNYYVSCPFDLVRGLGDSPHPTNGLLGWTPIDEMCSLWLINFIMVYEPISILRQRDLRQNFVWDYLLGSRTISEYRA